MKYLIFPLLLLSAQADAAVRRLSECGTFAGTPTEAAPFDLDLCPLGDGDDITQLLTDIQSKWPGGFFVRAPSRSINLVSGYVAWPTSTKTFVFKENENPANKLVLRHKPTDPATCVGQACGAFWTLWVFENFDTVKIGGPNLSITFRGNHPGFANCTQHYRPAIEIGWNADAAKICDINRGLLEFRMTDGGLATLADVRANVQYSQMFGIYSSGGAGEGGTANKIQQFNVSGTFFATSGVSLHYGSKNIWMDPDRTVFSDPYVRTWGWTGEVPGKTMAGLPMGCSDSDNDQVRIGMGGLAFDSMTGGFTIEYGSPNFVPRLTGKIGSSAADPFVIRVKDWGLSGPGTGYPAGVRVKKTGEAIFFKGDPADRFEGAGPVRFLRFEVLPSDFGNGSAGDRLTGCRTDNDWMDGISNIARFENNVLGRATRDYHIEFAGDWRSVAQGGTFLRGELIRFGSSADTAPNYGHTVRAAAGTIIADPVVLRDRSTITGPGQFADVSVQDASAAVPGRDSNIVDTTLSGKVTIFGGTENTTVRNVRFLGTAREIISIGTAANAIVSNLCAPAGSTIGGTGKLIYNGAVQVLPFTVSAALSGQCSQDPDDKPMPPGDIVVD